ncbi:MAG: hypothetical protein GY749_23760 [Desulfobacteraceae bacterium]|nr:hypothetical protein [Desulfobacteraceae bacterium]
MKKNSTTRETVSTILSEPSFSLATNLLREVGYDDRLEGCLMREHSGQIPVTVYNFEEAVRFLSDTFSLVDIAELVNWVRKAIGDKELSEKIEDAVRDEPCTMSGIRMASELMAQRLEQIIRKAGPMK